MNIHYRQFKTLFYERSRTIFYESSRNFGQLYVLKYIL
jgi:hypothetical protein